MPSFQQWTAVAALFPLALALPVASPQSLQPRAFSVTQVPNSFFSGHDGAAAYRKATLKYMNLLQTSDAAPSVKSANLGNVMLAESSNADANPIDSTDLEYLTPVIINQKQYLLDLDTGSSNLWIGGSNTAARNKYIPTGTAAAGQSWSISYGDGSQASGDVFIETVTIGDTTVSGVAVGRATQAPKRIFLPGANGQPGADGLLGLGFSGMSTYQPPQKTWLDMAVSQGLSNVFAADLRFGTEAGSYDFGQLNAAHYSGPITYTDVIKSADPKNQYWLVQPTEGDPGVMDTGTTLMLLSSDTTQKYYSQKAAVSAGARYSSTDQQWEYRCDSTLPDFSVTFGTSRIVVPGSYLSYQDLGNGYCYSAIQNRPDGMDFSIYGDRFLVTVYAIFDRTTGSPRVGFANKAAR